MEISMFDSGKIRMRMKKEYWIHRVYRACVYSQMELVQTMDEKMQKLDMQFGFQNTLNGLLQDEFLIVSHRRINELN
jgi:hypothetical protein